MKFPVINSNEPVATIYKVDAIIIIRSACECSLREAKMWLEVNYGHFDKYHTRDIGALIRAYYNVKLSGCVCGHYDCNCGE